MGKRRPLHRPAILAAYACGALDIIASCAALYRQGNEACYRVVAAQLRLLLCDTTRRHDRVVDVSLAPRILPGLNLHPLDLSTLAPNWSGELRFDSWQERLPLPAWLGQVIPLLADQPVTLRELIRAVCDQDGGAHVDLRVRGGALGPSAFRQPNGPAPHHLAIVCIGEYVQAELRALLRTAGLPG